MIDSSEESSETALTEAYRPESGERVTVPVAVEVPITIWLNRRRLVVLFATPTMLKELAIGHLLSEGILRSANEIDDVKVKGNSIWVKTYSDIEMRVKAAKTVKIIESQCGSTEDFYRLLDRIEKPMVKSELKVSVTEIRRMARELAANSLVFRKGCAVHSSAIFKDERIISLAEDIGRHNSTDKVIGAAASKNIDLSKTILVGTGRQPASLVLKTIRVGIPISVSFRGPIYSGVLVARRTGLTLVCVGRKSGLAVYSNPERISID